MELPKNYNAAEIELKWQKRWDADRIYSYDPASNAPVYSVDTPPPTVSADTLHVGHALSYTQAEIVVRYRRMRGYNIFYPMGFDDNGLPTERHVEKKYKVDRRKMSRAEFVRMCLKETTLVEKTYEELWRMLAISCDWSLLYTTIDPVCRRISQRSFIDLYRKGRMYREDAPSMWCTLCTTSLAQADLEDANETSGMHDISFDLGGGREGVISTTRPELLGACVALYVNPADERHKGLAGKKAKVPVYGHEVPVLESEAVSLDVGTGLMMVCTFGDVEDIRKWRADRLETRAILDRDGTFNSLAGPIAGMNVAAGRKEILRILESSGLLRGTKPVEHALNVHERCGTTVEFLKAPQWFIRILDIKDDLLRRGEELRWYPAFMKTNYDHWVNGLSWDWCISRQRYFGVPFPVWYCKGCGEVLIPGDGHLPVDPRENPPPEGSRCGKCGGSGFDPEMDVMDTWMTSSVTPLINARWREADSRIGSMYPMTMRPQAFEIIRTWLFYTTLKSHLHTDSLPFRDAMISGWGLDAKGKPFSKSKGNFVTVGEIVGKYSADALRFWAAGASLGQNLRFFEDDVKAGQKIAVKLWNVAKFSIPHLEKYGGGGAVSEPLDLWILSELRDLVKGATESFEKYEYSHAKTALERFFWTRFCDNYLEISKDRLYNADARGRAAWESACEALRTCLDSILRMFAPIMPFITEEIFMSSPLRGGERSIHVSPWPDSGKIPFDADAASAGSLAVGIISCARRYKTENHVSLKTRLRELIVEAAGDELQILTNPKCMDGIMKDLIPAAQAGSVRFGDAGEAKTVYPVEGSGVRVGIVPE